MKERPIIFSGPMVRANRAGLKDRTRRVTCPGGAADYLVNFDGVRAKFFKDGEAFYVACPYSVGDRLWVRETWRLFNGADECGHADFPCSCPAHGAPLYRATVNPDGHPAVDKECGPWRSSRFMPRWASRDTYEVTAVRVERLQAITEEDAVAEGIEWTGCISGVSGRKFYRDYQTGGHVFAVTSFASLWDSLNAKRPGCSWADNPWVWVIEYKPVETPA